MTYDATVGERKAALTDFLRSLGCVKRQELFILDGFDPDWYLVFDVSDNPERPDTWGTADIRMGSTGHSAGRLDYVLKSNVDPAAIRQLLIALGPERFSDRVQAVLNDPDRGDETIPKLYAYRHGDWVYIGIGQRFATGARSRATSTTNYFPLQFLPDLPDGHRCHIELTADGVRQLGDTEQVI